MLQSLIIKMVIRFCLHQVLSIIVRQLCMAIVSGYSRQTTHNIYLIFAPSRAGNEWTDYKKKDVINTHTGHVHCPGNHSLWQDVDMCFIEEYSMSLISKFCFIVGATLAECNFISSYNDLYITYLFSLVLQWLTLNLTGHSGLNWIGMVWH
jgi:hypothetical protein